MLKNIDLFKPDFVIDKGSHKFIIDTKWKNIDYSEPSTHDLRQMYVYNDYWQSDKAMLLYPSNTTKEIKEEDFELFKNNKHACSLGKISIFAEDKETLNETIGTTILKWFGVIPLAPE